MKRRRVLTILAAAMLPLRPARADGMAGHRPWRRGAGGSVAAPTATPARRWPLCLPLLADLEAEFSLYRPSSLTRLNRDGRLDPSPAFRALLSVADAVHRATSGAFDPTVQPLWSALARGEDTGPAAAAIGWDRVGLGAPVTLGPGQALSLNGIAQGFATDAALRLLADHGFTEALVDLGEAAALGGPFRLALEDPEFGPMGTRSLTDTAIATSSPRATLVGGRPHILHPQGRPALWSTVSVEARSATLADALSTAAVFLSPDELRQARARLPGVGRITLVDPQGDLSTL